MAYYSICPVCGAHNDPGERCDCRRLESREAAKAYQAIRSTHKDEIAERDAAYRRTFDLLGENS